MNHQRLANHLEQGGWKDGKVVCADVVVGVDLFLSARSEDMWGLGCLVWEVFNGRLPQATVLKNTAQVCCKMEGAVVAMVTLALLSRSLHLLYPCTVVWWVPTLARDPALLTCWLH